MQAMQADDSSIRAATASPLPMIVMVAAVGPLLATPVFILPFIGDIPWSFLAIGALSLMGIAGGGGLLAWRMRRRASRTPLQRVLCAVVSVTSNRAVYNPLTFILQLPNGERFQCEGLAPVASRMVAPGDIGVAFLTQSINGLAAADFIRIDV